MPREKEERAQVGNRPPRVAGVLWVLTNRPIGLGRQVLWTCRPPRQPPAPKALGVSVLLCLTHPGELMG